MGKEETVQLGDMVAAAFDSAADCSADPRVVSRVAALLVARILRRAQLLPSTSDRGPRAARLREHGVSS